MGVDGWRETGMRKEGEIEQWMDGDKGREWALTDWTRVLTHCPHIQC